MLSLWEIYKRFFQNSFHFKGKSGRQEYWTIFVTNMILVGVFVTAITMFEAKQGIAVMMGIYLAVTCIPWTSLTVRRLHDTGKSGFWCLLTLIPWGGPIILFILCSRESSCTGR